MNIYYLYEYILSIYTSKNLHFMYSVSHVDDVVDFCALYFVIKYLTFYALIFQCYIILNFPNTYECVQHVLKLMNEFCCSCEILNSFLTWPFDLKNLRKIAEVFLSARSVAKDSVRWRLFCNTKTKNTEDDLILSNAISVWKDSGTGVIYVVTWPVSIICRKNSDVVIVEENIHIRVSWKITCDPVTASIFKFDADSSSSDSSEIVHYLICDIFLLAKARL